MGERQFIKWLHREIADYRAYVLIMDVYPSHWTDCVLATAEGDDAEVLFVPTRGTGRFQPVDCRIFGELKARAQGHFERRVWREGPETMDHQTSVDILEKCWASLPSDRIQKAWNIVQLKFSSLMLC
jgi:hypothetical protein